MNKFEEFIYEECQMALDYYLASMTDDEFNYWRGRYEAYVEACCYMGIPYPKCGDIV